MLTSLRDSRVNW